MDEKLDLTAKERRQTIDMKRTTLCDRVFQKEIINQSPLALLKQRLDQRQNQKTKKD